jgi:perosamine synthetase
LTEARGWYSGEVPRSIQVSKPDIGELENSYVQRAMQSGWISSSGEFVDEFQQRWAKNCGSEYSLCVSNGTVALHLILVGMGIGPGDEVIVPSLTFIASVNAINYVGATPVFCDVNIDTWCLDVESVANLATEKTKAVINVDLYGNPSGVVDLEIWCRQNEILLIDDAAEAPFATNEGRQVGSFGAASSFSFFGNKIITSGEGGAITTSDHELYNKMKRLRDQGMDPNRRYYFPEIGFNYRLTNIQCALLCAQLDRKKELLTKREEVFSEYDKHLRNLEFFSFQSILESSTRSPWLYTFIMNGRLGDNKESVIEDLAKLGVETRPIFIPVHTLPPYQGIKTSDLPNTEMISKSGLSLPTSSTMNLNDVEFICSNFLKVCRQYT